MCVCMHVYACSVHIGVVDVGAFSKKHESGTSQRKRKRETEKGEVRGEGGREPVAASWRHVRPLSLKLFTQAYAVRTHTSVRPALHI